jgi:RNA polymerase primary sigma factor
MAYSKKFFNQENIPLDIYLRDIGEEDLLTPEEEIQLAKEIRKGNQQAMNKLITTNLRFVVSVAKQYQNKGLPLNDLINEGNLGLIKSAQRFDETKNCKFISYAVWWIRQSILQAIAEQSRVVRLPLNKVSELNKYLKVTKQLEQELHRNPTIEEVAEEMGVTVNEVNDIIQVSKRSVYINSPLTQNSQYSMQDMLVDESFHTIEERINKVSLRANIDNVLLMLTKREANVIKRFFGLGMKQTCLDEIGEELHLTRERVRQIKEKAIKKIKKLKIFDTLREFINNDDNDISEFKSNYEELLENLEVTNKNFIDKVNKKRSSRKNRRKPTPKKTETVKK